MANYATLKSAIEQVIKTNGNNEITGALLQQSLLSMINSLGAGYQFIGVAVLSPTPTNPGTPDQNVFYIAGQSGTYSNFGGLVVAENEIAIFKYNGIWTKEITGAATSKKVSELDEEITISDNINLKTAVVSGFYINTGNVSVGSVVDISNPTVSAPFGYIIVSCNQGDVFKIKGRSGTAPRLYAFTDTNYTLISKSGDGYYSDTFIEITAPDDGFLICDFALAYSYDLIQINNITVKEKIAEIEDIVYYNKNLNDDFVIGQYINTGAVSIGATVDVSNPVQSANTAYLLLPVIAGDIIFVKGLGGSNSRLWAFTDNNYKLLNKSTLDLLASDYLELVAPSNGYLIVDVIRSTQYDVYLPNKQTVKDVLDNEIILREQKDSEIKGDLSLLGLKLSSFGEEVFNLDTQPVIFEKPIIQNPGGDATVILNYVGKIIMSLEITAPIGVSYTVFARNKATGNDVSWRAIAPTTEGTTIILNPRPELEQDNLRIYTATTSDGWTGSIKFSKANYILPIADNVLRLNEWVAKDYIKGVFENKITSLVSPSRSTIVPCILKEGNLVSFYFKPNVDTAITIEIRDKNNVSVIGIVNNAQVLANSEFYKEISINRDDLENIIFYTPSTATNIGVAEIVIRTNTRPSYPRFQFGLTSDGDYNCPTIPAFSPPAGSLLSYFYGLYDALVADYPNYITKINCDTECVAAGIERPAYMNGYPIYMYKFIPSYTPNSSIITNHDTAVNRLKVYIVCGTHPEYIGIYDTYNMMRLICQEWENDKNLEEMRWNCEFYIIPCSNPYGVENAVRTNYNGVDLNRNAPSLDWILQGQGTVTYSGPSAASEYETKVMVHYMEEIVPEIFIDRHNSNTGSGDNLGDNKNMIYVTSRRKCGYDIGGALISQMTRKWKKKYTDVFPSNSDDDMTIFGFAQNTVERGTRAAYACDFGTLGLTAESNNGILYDHGNFGAQYRQTNTSLVCTCATEGLVNLLLRLLTFVSRSPLY